MTFDYELDFALTDPRGRVIEVIEIKARKKHYSSVMLSLSKVWAAKRFACAVPRVSFIVEMPDISGRLFLWKLDLTTQWPKPWPIYMGGRNDREKVEPVILLPLTWFTALPVDGC